jgi:hypothetical protein
MVIEGGPPSTSTRATILPALPTPVFFEDGFYLSPDLPATDTGMLDEDGLPITATSSKPWHYVESRGGVDAVLARIEVGRSAGRDQRVSSWRHRAYDNSLFVRTWRLPDHYLAGVAVGLN